MKEGVIHVRIAEIPCGLISEHCVAIVLLRVDYHVRVLHRIEVLVTIEEASIRLDILWS